MDSLTHIVLGHAMGIFAQSATPAAQTAAYWGAFVGNSLPDIDVPVGTLLGRGWALHRKFTHTIPGMLLLPALATGVITLVVPGSSPWLTYAWTLAGVMLHVFLDCLNSFGTRPLKPFSNRFFGYGVLFIMDPVILVVLGVGDLVHLAGWLPRVGLQVLTVAMAVYVAARWVALARLSRSLAHSTAPAEARLVVTAFLAGWRFFRERQGLLEYGSVDFLGLHPRTIETVVPATGPAVEASRQVPAIARFLERARFPFARVEERDGLYRVEWQDLFLRMRGKPPTIEVFLDADLSPV